MSNKDIWEEHGKESPYYSVATLSQFKDENLDEQGYEDFFRSGEEYISTIWQHLNEQFDNDFHPKKTLDFGCGVGRLTLALAKRSKTILGVDVSSTMIEEANKNKEKRDVNNASFKKVSEDMSDLKDEFDLIHSFIVLQHINPSIGYKVISRLIDSLTDGGIGILQMTYANPSPTVNKITRATYQNLPLVFKLRNLLLSNKAEPILPMYKYDLNEIFELLRNKGCHKISTRFTSHGFNGLILFFQKRELEVL